VIHTAATLLAALALAPDPLLPPAEHAPASDPLLAPPEFDPVVSPQALTPDRALSLSDCVAAALEGSASVAHAEALVDEYRARLAEVESSFYPKLFGRFWTAPMFTVEGTALEPDVVRRWKSISDWGPYTHLEAVLALPIYTFGRGVAGETAATERLDVERARLREARNATAREVKRFYYAHLYAASLLPTLRSAARSVDGAIEKGEEFHESGSGKVTQADLARLRYGRAELARYILEAEDGAALSLSALKHTMGWPEERDLVLAEGKLQEPEAQQGEQPPDRANPEPEEDGRWSMVDGRELPSDTIGDEHSFGSLEEALEAARQARPEWDQVRHGVAAAEALESAERKAVLPVLFVAGVLTVDWTPTRDDSPNPYHYDPYNQVIGGVAVGLQFNIDIASAASRGDQAAALRRQVLASARLAETGIPLQVRKAYTEMQRAQSVVEITRASVKETKKWMIFSAAAYSTGAGEAKDLLEGLAAYVKSKQTHYEALRALHDAKADLDLAVGTY